MKDAYPLPRIDDILDTLSGAKYFSTIDMASGYWQCEVQEEDKPKTAFVTTEGLHEFNVMPFGLCNAPGTYQRLMDLTLADLQWKTSLIYLDDVIILGNDFGQHLDILREVFERIRAAKLKINPEKCQLLREYVQFLGHIVSAEGVKTDPQKVAAVKNWATPSNVDELRSFIGTASYYRRFIKNFATTAAPLHNLTKKEQKFIWDTYCENAFRELKGKLISALILAYSLKDSLYDTKSTTPGGDTTYIPMIQNPTAKTYLLKIYNQIWNEHLIPEEWKQAVIIPIQKPNKNDLEKAFDRTNKSKILHQLHLWGLRGNIPLFIQTFLTTSTRTFTVKILNQTSNVHSLGNGIPQDSVLSATLFNIAINDIVDQILKPIKSIIFADDIVIYIDTANETYAQQCLQKATDNINEWHEKCVEFLSPHKKRNAHDHDTDVVGDSNISITDDEITAKFDADFDTNTDFDEFPLNLTTIDWEKIIPDETSKNTEKRLKA
ncbi:uncharacterized protein LOC123301324 [Chrysoperla carnea]|uniref:uncharacterized protein LOC123301324 n=1 Tax=Chrysoperla carnea TaxID=189513 RepID=UPI001D08034F|nr:uncharacterized protein LOC123301324 [Chrysoperla carnea]